MRYQQVLVLVALAALVGTGCRKEADDQRPSVTIISPAEFSSITVPDTVAVQISATDDRGLERISVTLIDEQHVPVVPTVHAGVSGTSATVTLHLPIVSEQLRSGIYKLYATASDGSDEGRDFLDVHVSAAPLRLRAVFTIASTGPDHTALYRTDSAGHTTLVRSYNFTLGGAAIGSTAQRLVIAGGPSGDLLAMEPDHLAVQWMLPNQSAVGAPWFTCVDRCADGRLYVGQDNSTIRALGMGTGTGHATAVITAGYRPGQAVTTEHFLITTERHIAEGNHRLGVYFRESGMLDGQQPLPLDPVELAIRDAGHVLIFGNVGGQGKVLDRTLAGGGTWEAYTWATAITAATHVGGAAWLVALANGDLHRYTYGGMGSLGLGSPGAFSTLAYDPLNGVVYAGGDGQVSAIDPTTGNVQPLWTVAGQVLRVLPLYNRDP